MNANLTDKDFTTQPNAVFVVGNWGDNWINQFAGTGPSSHQFKFKALLVDGIVYIPDPAYATRTPKRNRNYANYPMVKARHQPPQNCIIRAAS